MKETTRFKLFYATAFGCGLFILLTAIAMFFYVGGTAQDPTRTSYSFSFNFFSDLGRTQGFNGNSNLTSSVLFTTAAVLAGTGLIPYFQAIQEVIKGVTKRQRVWAKTGAILSVPVALAYGGIGLIPCNISYLGHMIMVGIAFLGSIPVLMANIFAFKNQKDFPVDLKRGYYVLISIIFLYLLINAFSLL